MSTPGVSLTKWFPQISDNPTPQELSLRVRQIYNTMNQHDQAIETVHQNVENLTQNVDANTASINTSVTKTITITDIEGFGNLAAVNDQTGQTAYTVQSSDNGSLVVLNDASAIAVTLNSVVTAPYFVFIANQGTGTATLTASGGVINGITSVPGGSSVIAFFDGSNWWIWAVSFVSPNNTPAVTHEWLKSFNSTTGAFTQTQPAFTDISGIATVAQGGTGTSTPALVPGTGVTITGSWPGQTINATGTGGTVISVAMTVPTRQTVSGSPVTTSGTLAITDNTQNANQVFAGPTSGSAAAPTFRPLVAADIPASGVTSLNALTGALNVAAGTGIAVVASGSSITVSAATSPTPTLFVQGNNNYTTGVTAAAAFTSSNTAGNCLIVDAIVQENFAGAGSLSIADSQGNTYTLAGGTTHERNNALIATWYALNCTAGANTVTVTYSTSTTHPGMAVAVHEYSGVKTVSAFDTSAYGFADIFSDLPISLSLTTAAAGDLLHLYASGESPITFSNSASWTQRAVNNAGTASLTTYDATAGAAGSVSNSLNTSGTGIYMQGYLLALKAVPAVIGSGTVTSVAMTVPSILSVSGSPITSSGTLALTLATETANTVFAGPSSGSAATPTFRAIAAADLPLGSSSAFGALKVDGTSITATAGVISAPGGGSSPLTTKGDVWGYSTTNARIPIGTDTFVLTADSTQTLGLKWAASASGFANPMTTLGDIIAGGSGGTAGRLGIGSTGNVLTVVAGAPAWAPASGGGGFSIYPTLTIPLSANFSWLNPNSYGVTNTDKTDRLLLTAPTGTNGAAFMQTASLPSAPYTIDVGFLLNSSQSVVLVALALKNSGAGTIRSYGIRANTAGSLWLLNDQTFTSIIAPSTQNNTTGAFLLTQSLLFLRITDDGTNRNTYWSYNGKDYELWLSQASGTGVSPDKAGILVYNATGNFLETISVYHWLISNSVLPIYAS